MSTILDPVRYAAANANTRGRMARLLPVETWPALLRAADLDELVAILNRRAYQATLAGLAAEGAAIEPVEKALWGYLVREIQATRKLLPGKPRELVDWLWRRFEIDNLKTILRSVDAGIAPHRIQAALIPVGQASTLPWTALTEAPSGPALVEQLRAASLQGAFYGRAMAPALARYRQTGEIFGLEVSLDLAYYRRLLRLVDDLSGRDRREAKKLIGSRIDSQNLLWAFRYRVYFDLSPEEILNYTLQRRLRVDADVVREIALDGSIRTVVRRLWPNELPDLERVTALDPAEALPRLQLSFRRYHYTLALTARQGYPLHLGSILAYFVLLESEIRDLIAIIEGQAAGWPPDRIQSFLIGLGRKALEQ